VTVLAGGTFYGCDNIREVRSYIEEPFYVIDEDDMYGDMLRGGRCFPEAVTQEAVLYVPQGTVEKYRSMRGWRDFLNIKESSQTVIETPTYTNDTSLPYYTLDGRRSIGLPTKGIYIQNGRKRVVSR
jgi:hypothetical protein